MLEVYKRAVVTRNGWYAKDILTSSELYEEQRPGQVLQFVQIRAFKSEN